MKAVSLAEVKKELGNQDSERLLEICMRMAKHKRENKELLTYLLFESDDELAFLQGIKSEMDEQFSALVKEKNLYFLKKTIRKILRLANKQIRFSGIKESEIEVRIYFCRLLKDSGIHFDKSPVLLKMYQMQLKKINLALSKLPEDLQFDYQQSVGEITL